MFLTKDELVAMTKYVMPKKMCEFLAERGYKFDLDRYGYPLVLKAAIEQRLGVIMISKAIKHIEPDYAALKKFKKPKGRVANVS